MRKIVVLMHVSLDGFAAGPKGEMNWIHIDDEMFEDVDGMFTTADAALYGRVTYQMMESYWPTVPGNPASTAHDIRHTHWLDAANKVVFSKTLEKAEWQNTTLLKGNFQTEVMKLKEQPGQDISVVGSLSVTHELMRLNLIDEYRINVNPVVLGQGLPFFKDVQSKLELKLVNAKTYNVGVVALRYVKK
jgi:dihydrofolate reductase